MPTAKTRLTAEVADQAQPAGREYVLWDDRLPGFGLRVRSTGSKSFVYTYRSAGGRAGKVRRMTLRSIKASDAFKEATALAAQFYTGSDPATAKAAEREEVVKARKALTVTHVLDRFIADHAKTKLKPATWGEYERVADKLLKPQLGSTKIDALEPQHVAKMHHDLRATPTQAAAAVRVLSSAMSWAEERGLRKPGQNPAKIRLKGSRRRQRLFSDVEVQSILKAIGEVDLMSSAALALRLLFATGCRAGEICQLRWSDVDFDGGFIRWPDTKTGYLEKPMTGEARALLKGAVRIVGSPWVCPATNPKKPLRVDVTGKAMHRVMKKAGVNAGENASSHLIRHWFSTQIYTDSEIALPVQLAITGHKSVATAMRYAHTTRDQVQAAAAGAAKRRGAAIKAAGKRSKVVPING